MPKKVFIYEDQYSAYFSILDLRDLFRTPGIFSETPDISIGSFNFNTDGLINPLFVVPGGSTSSMGKSVVPQLQTISANLDNKFDYLGICAGGFHATDSAILATTDFLYDGRQITLNPAYFGPLASLKLFPDYKSLGAFYPNYSRFYLLTHKSFVPYRVTLSFPGTERKLDQLYIAGPAFVPNDSIVEEKSEVIATYADEKIQQLCVGKSSTKCFVSSAAIISKLATETHGARLISATHIETCVKGSKLLAACEKDSDISVALPKDDYEKLISQQEETQKEVVSLLRRTFNR